MKVKKTKNILHKRFTLTAVLLLVGCVALVLIALPKQLKAEVKSANKTVLGTGNNPEILRLEQKTQLRTYVSEELKTDFKFNAVAPHWHVEFGNEENIKVEIRVSENGRDWSDWLEIKAEGPLRDDLPFTGHVYPETPIFITGQHAQHRITLRRGANTGKSPVVSDLKLNYINSEASLTRKLAARFGVFLAKVSAAEQGPSIITRSGWGSPDPHGNKYKNTNKYWQPTYEPVKQVFLHHTVTDSQQSDPKAVMRAIWDYHANTLGWGDIGYNYVVDSEGKIYEGRFGGENVIAGHVRNYNKGSMGVAVLGCFQPGTTCDQVNSGPTKAPPTKVINGLTTLLSWKTTNYEINPKASHTFCDVNGKNCKNLKKIAAHRDAGITSCNGDLFYEKMADIRNQTDGKNTNSPWSYSAKQLHYNNIVLKDEPLIVNITFKNTGAATWSNTESRLLLRTASPANRKSQFQGGGWINDTTPATLSEVSVDPDQTGTFSFELKRPSGVAGSFFEGFRLTSEGNTSLKGYFNFRVLANTRHPDGTLIKGSDPKVYLIENSKRRHVKSRQVFESHGFEWSQVRKATPADFDLPIDSKLDFREGALVQGESNPVYAIDYETGAINKRHITSRQIFDDLGFSFEEVLKIKDSQLPVSDGAVLNTSETHPDGTLIRKIGTNPVYLIETGKKRHIVSRYAFESHGYLWSNIKNATPGDLELALGNVLSFREGILLQGAGNPVYVVDLEAGGLQKRHIVSRSIFDALSYKFSEIIKVPDELIPETSGPNIE